MADRTFQLVLQYDGAEFSGWQRQRDARTVQGELERVFSRLSAAPTNVIGAGRTDAGVHASGQSAHVILPEKWACSSLLHAANSLLPNDIFISDIYEMKPDFHARFKALTRAYKYQIGTDKLAMSPFRRKYEWAVKYPLDRAKLDECAALIMGDHCFRGFAVKGTAPEDDHHRSIVYSAGWEPREGGLLFRIEANRFLHHMVRFLVGTMIEVASGKRDVESMKTLLEAEDNREVAPPAPSKGLFLTKVSYPKELYISDFPNPE